MHELKLRLFEYSLQESTTAVPSPQLTDEVCIYVPSKVRPSYDKDNQVSVYSCVLKWNIVHLFSYREPCLETLDNSMPHWNRLASSILHTLLLFSS